MDNKTLALLDKMDRLHAVTTPGEWEGDNGDVTWADYPREPEDGEEPDEEYLAVVGSGASDLIAECKIQAHGEIAECYAPDYRLGPRNNSAWIAAVHNAYPALATALRAATARADAAEEQSKRALTLKHACEDALSLCRKFRRDKTARIAELEAERNALLAERPRLVETTARLVKQECKDDIAAEESPTYAAGPINLIDEARMPLLAEVEAAMAREALKTDET